MDGLELKTESVAAAAIELLPALAVSERAQQRSARRRSHTPQLRAPTDDGFHLFRVY